MYKMPAKCQDQISISAVIRMSARLVKDACVGKDQISMSAVIRALARLVQDACEM